MCNLNPLPQGEASAVARPAQGPVPTFLAIIHELVTCSTDSASKFHLWRLLERTMFYGAERHQLTLFLSHEAEGAPTTHRTAAYCALRSFEEWREDDRVPFPIAFAEVFDDLPKGKGEEFHLLRLLERIDPRFEGRSNISDLIMGRVPLMLSHQRDMAYAVMKHLDAGDEG